PAHDVLVQAARGGEALSGDRRGSALGDVARVPRLRLPSGRREDDVEVARARPQLILRSLALKTELGLAATRAKIVDRGDYVVITTPDDPGYYYGNLLLL